MSLKLPEGYSIRYTHYRVGQKSIGFGQFDEGYGTVAELRDEGYVPQPHGGETWATVIDPSGEAVTTSAAFCHPNDNFDRRIGRLIATGRAIEEFYEYSMQSEYEPDEENEAPTGFSPSARGEWVA